MNVSHADALGQLLIIELNERSWTGSCERLLRLYRPGGILLSGESLRAPASCAELLREVGCALGSVPFLVLEEEGGTLNPLRAFLPPLPSPRAAAQKGPPAVERLGQLAGAALKFLGFNTNLAPVLDLATPSSEPILGTRAFSPDAHQVARCGEAFVRGLRRHEILACGKHFPGLGGLQIQGESSLPVVGKPMGELWREDLVPYRELLKKLPLVIVSHCAYKAYDFDVLRPAAVSASVLQGLLRVKLGYHKVALADIRQTEAISSMLDLVEAGVRSVNAGCDLLLLGRGEQSIQAVFSGLRKAIESGKLSTRRLQKSLGRIRLAKKRLTPPTGRISKRTLDQLVRQFESFSKECQAPGGEDQKIAESNCTPVLTSRSPLRCGPVGRGTDVRHVAGRG